MNKLIGISTRGWLSRLNFTLKMFLLFNYILEIIKIRYEEKFVFVFDILLVYSHGVHENSCLTKWGRIH